MDGYDVWTILPSLKGEITSLELICLAERGIIQDLHFSGSSVMIATDALTPGDDMWVSERPYLRKPRDRLRLVILVEKQYWESSILVFAHVYYYTYYQQS